MDETPIDLKNKREEYFKKDGNHKNINEIENENQTKNGNGNGNGNRNENEIKNENERNNMYGEVGAVEGWGGLSFKDLLESPVLKKENEEEGNAANQSTTAKDVLYHLPSSIFYSSKIYLQILLYFLAHVVPTNPHS